EPRMRTVERGQNRLGWKEHLFAAPVRAAHAHANGRDLEWRAEGEQSACQRLEPRSAEVRQPEPLVVEEPRASESRDEHPDLGDGDVGTLFSRGRGEFGDPGRTEPARALRREPDERRNPRARRLSDDEVASRRTLEREPDRRTTELCRGEDACRME